ncbi:MAG: hypothetical protein ACOX7D_02905 [Alphaproteobacteria bacterium]|jgi:hypothetical protein
MEVKKVNHEKIAKDLLRFNVKQEYFGNISSDKLNNAWKLIKTSATWGEPITEVNIHVGYINSTIIFNSLWEQMSYNPVRWGDKNPFGDKGIINFCEKVKIYNSEIIPIKHNLQNFLYLNAKPNGQWHEEILTNVDRTLTISRNKEGKPNNNYWKIRVLLNCIKLITGQNVKDFNNKKGPYRNDIINKLSQIFQKQVKISDFGLVPDCPPEQNLKLFEKINLITQKEWDKKYKQHTR